MSDSPKSLSDLQKEDREKAPTVDAICERCKKRWQRPMKRPLKPFISDDPVCDECRMDEDKDWARCQEPRED